MGQFPSFSICLPIIMIMNYYNCFNDIYQSLSTVIAIVQVTEQRNVHAANYTQTESDSQHLVWIALDLRPGMRFFYMEIP